MTSDDKALVERLRILPDGNGLMYKDYDDVMQAADLIEQHEAFRQEVSDAVADAKFMIETHCDEEASTLLNNRLSRFIIPAPKPDPLVEAMHDCGVDRFESWADQLRAALEARGLEIRSKNDD